MEPVVIARRRSVPRHRVAGRRPGPAEPGADGIRGWSSWPRSSGLATCRMGTASSRRPIAGRTQAAAAERPLARRRADPRVASGAPAGTMLGPIVRPPVPRRQDRLAKAHGRDGHAGRAGGARRGRARRFRIRDESGHCVVARLHGQYGGQDGAAPAGRPARLPEHARADRQAVRADDGDELARPGCRRVRTPNTRSLTTQHYVIFYQCKLRFAQDSGRLLEDLYRGLIDVCRTHGSRSTSRSSRWWR